MNTTAAVLATFLSAAAGVAHAQEAAPRCLPASGGPGAIDAPWHYHYEQGVALAARDPARALVAFAEATRRRPHPDPLARTYGVWRLDYQPYMQIARVHARMGSMDCALTALAESISRGETSDAQRGREELEELSKKTGQTSNRRER